MAQKNKTSVRAVILAGGKGTRLKPLTAVFPKPLVPLGNKPILEILLRRLASSGLTDVTICTGYLAELIKAVCGDGSKFGLRIEYVGEEQPLGTAGPLSLIPNLTDPFIVMNGDLLTTLNFRSMLQFHNTSRFHSAARAATSCSTGIRATRRCAGCNITIWCRRRCGSS